MTKRKTRKPATAEDRILQLSNDLSEGIDSGTRAEWMAAARYFRDHLDTVQRELDALMADLILVAHADGARAFALRSLQEKVNRR